MIRVIASYREIVNVILSVGGITVVRFKSSVAYRTFAPCLTRILRRPCTVILRIGRAPPFLHLFRILRAGGRSLSALRLFSGLSSLRWRNRPATSGSEGSAGRMSLCSRRQLLRISVVFIHRIVPIPYHLNHQSPTASSLSVVR